jgi:hypothetical protein
MSTYRTEIDAKEILKALNQFVSKDTKKIYANALYKVANKLVIKTKQNLRKSFTGGKNLQKAVVRKKYTTDEKEMEVKVHIMGTYSKGKEKKGYVARFFEKGAVNRWIRPSGKKIKNRERDNEYYGRKKRIYKKQAYRGSIKGEYFFRDALEEVRQTISNDLVNEIETYTQKQWDKKYN